MIAKIYKILLIFLMIFLTIGPIKMHLPFFTDIRRMIAIPLLAGMIYILSDTKSRTRLLNIVRSPTGIILLLFLFQLLISSIVHIPSDEFKTILSYVFGIMAFFFGYAILFSVNKPWELFKSVFFVVVATNTLSNINSLLVLIIGKPFIEFSDAFIISKITTYRLYDYTRGRIYATSYTEFIIPFVAFIYLLRKQKISAKILIALTLTLEMLTLFLSNYRSRVMAGIAGMTLIFFFNRITKRLLMSILLLPLILSLFLQAKTGSILNRFLLKDEIDTATITDRVIASAKAVNIGSRNFLLGVGSGNFINYTDWIWTSEDNKKIVTYQNPHNTYLMLFAETGILSTLTYIFIITLMLKSDYDFIVGQKIDTNTIILPFIVSSWIYIATSLINWYPANYIVFFFLIRGFIYGWYDRYAKI